MSGDIEAKWRQFHKDNPDVYRLFKSFAMTAIHAGHKHFSADAVMHRVRWETSVVTSDDTFKVNNNWVAYYARLFMADHPEHDGFFRTRAVNRGGDNGGT